jgi:hypothetical protein
MRTMHMAVLLMLLTLAIKLCGCGSLVDGLPVIGGEPAVPAGTAFEPRDVDGDGVADASYYYREAIDPQTGQVGKVLLTDAEGRPIEVPNTRATLSQAKTVDESTGDLVAILGSLLGGGVLTAGAGAAIKRLKPATTATTLWQLFKGTVASVEGYKAQLPAEQRQSLATALRRTQAAVPGLEAAVDRARAELGAMDGQTVEMTPAGTQLLG